LSLKGSIVKTGLSLDILASARNAMTAARQKIAELDRDINAAEAERADLYLAPMNKADFLAVMAKAIKAKAHEHLVLMARTFSSEGGRIGSEVADLVGTDRFYYHPTMPGFGLNPPVIEAAFCLFSEEGINAGLRRVADAMTWPEDSIPLAERAERLNALDTKIAALRTQRNALADALA